MVSKNYFSNMPSKNILQEEKNKNLSEDLIFDFKDTSFDNMILNSNLHNQNLIK